MALILMVATRIPYPENDGYKKRVLAIARMVKRAGHNVRLIAATDRGQEKDAERLMKEQSYFDGVSAIKIGFIRKICNLLVSAIKGVSLQERLYYSPRLMRKIENEIGSNAYSAVIWIHIRLLPYMERLASKIKLNILDYVDSIAYHYQSTKNQTSIIWSLIYKYEGARVLKAERRAVCLNDVLWITSQADKEYIDGQADKIRVVPMGVNEELLSIDSMEKEHAVAFIGKMNYNANVDAVIFFVRSILRKIEDPTLKFYIIGISPSRRVVALMEEDERVKVTGFIENAYEKLAGCEIVVAPIRMGGGIQNKILEGMALGKPVLTFSDRVLPFPGISQGKEICAVKSEVEYYSQLKALLDDEQMRRRIGAEARNYIRKNFLWGKIQDLVDADLKRLR